MENSSSSNILLSEADIQRVLKRIAHEILEKNKGIESIAIVGIQTRGVLIAEAIADLVEQIEGHRPEVGSLDITFYRDDIATMPHPILKGTEINFDISDKKIILVDDVLFTGRTIRAALDALMDMGRPKLIQLAVLVDRGHRELPIRPDYVGKNIPTAKDEQVRVHLNEIDGATEVVISKVKNG